MGGYETPMGFFIVRGILWVQLQLFGFLYMAELMGVSNKLPWAFFMGKKKPRSTMALRGLSFHLFLKRGLCIL